MSLTDEDNFFDDEGIHIARLVNSTNTGLWEYDISTKDIRWSAGFYRILGYEAQDTSFSYDHFLEDILYFEDKPVFLQSVNKPAHDDTQRCQIRLLTQRSGYRWFESVTQKLDTASGPRLIGSLVDIHENKLLKLQASKNDSQFRETIKIASIGSWEIDVKSKSLTLSRGAYDIYELQGQVKLSIDEAVSFFEPEYRKKIGDAITEIMQYSRPFDLSLLFRTAKNNIIWLRAKGLAIIDDLGRCITVKGIFQNIDHLRKKEIEVENAVDLLSDQNKRLQNFAYIVSHNLRSHTGNLQFMVNLFEQTEVEDDRKEIFSHVKSISQSLNTTIEHLSEIVRIQTELDKERKKLSLEDTLNNVLSALENNIQATNAVIVHDFSKCTDVYYIPAYLESIFQNLVTNSIKYKHPDRAPYISISSAREGNHTYLYFEDNGMGIDLERYGDSLFGMYKTFHDHPEAKGIGLFITRNQIEALGGTIRVESTVNAGTKFTIKLI